MSLVGIHWAWDPKGTCLNNRHVTKLLCEKDLWAKAGLQFC